MNLLRYPLFFLAPSGNVWRQDSPTHAGFCFHYKARCWSHTPPTLRESTPLDMHKNKDGRERGGWRSLTEEEARVAVGPDGWNSQPRSAAQ